MVKATTTAGADPDAALKRLGGGRWATRDERFTIEPQSGTWVVIDTEQTDELGLPLVRGPFASLTAAKAAISAARSSLPAESPLEARAVAIRSRDAPRPKVDRRSGRRPIAGPQAAAATPRPSLTPPPPAEPGWIAALPPADRRRARRLIERLTAVGASDAEAIARRDIVGAVAAAAGFAVTRAIQHLGSSAAPSTVARLLADGADEDLGVRWRLVDGDGRVITLALDDEAPGR